MDIMDQDVRTNARVKLRIDVTQSQGIVPLTPQTPQRYVLLVS